MAPVTPVLEESATATEQPAAQSDAGQAAESENIRSLAVMPLENSSTDPAAEYLTDGLTESVVNCLSLVPELLVKACGSVHEYK